MRLLESLESRRHFTAVPSVAVSSGTLSIAGTSRADHVVVTRVGDLVPAAGVKAFSVISDDGTHVVAVDSKAKSGVQSNPSAADLGLPTGDYLRVDANGVETFYPAAGVRKVHIDAGGGNDSVEIAKSVGLPTTLIGARGDDTLAGGTRLDVISGGAGDDLLFGGAGTARDRFDASSGKDTVVSNAADDSTPAANTNIEGPANIFGGSFNRITEIILGPDGVLQI